MGNPFSPVLHGEALSPIRSMFFYTVLQNGILTDKPLFFIDNFKWLAFLFLKRGLSLNDSIY